MQNHLSDRVGRRRSAVRAAIAKIAAASLIATSLAAGVATTAQAATLAIRGDSDGVQALVTQVTSNKPNAGSSESVDSLADRNASTKWYAKDGGTTSESNPQWAIYTLSEAASATAYSLTSAGDSASYKDRDPKAWRVYGSNDDAAASDADSSSWELVDTQTNQAFGVNGLTRVYTIADPASYKYYQLRVVERTGTSSNLQIADWTLRSGAVGYTSTLIDAATTWQYLDDPAGTVDPAAGATDRTAWTAADATLPGTWTNGTAPFGAKRNGTNLGANFPVTTTLPLDRGGTSDNTVPAYFFRYEFELDQAAVDSIAGMYGTVIHDDAIAIYLNGEQVFANYEGSTVTTNLQYAGGELTDPRTDQLSWNTDALQAGTNVLSVELHNVNKTSSDVYFSMPYLNVTSDPLPVPFTNDELNASYSSDTQPAGIDNSDFFIDQLLNFNEVKTNNPELLSDGSNAPKFEDESGNPLPGGPTNPRTEGLTAANDRVSVTINNNAAGDSPSQVEKRQQAQADNDGFSTQRMSNGLGTVLGPIFESALTSGKLPKTYWLLNKKIEQGRNHEPAKAYYKYKRPFNRMGFVNAASNPCGGSGELAGTFTGSGRIEPNLGSSYGLCDNGSLPSGHTNHGYAQGTILATLLPELAPQVMYRASEYANSRIILGFHYPLDVMTGRMAGNATAAQRWDDPEMAKLLLQARDELAQVLGEYCVQQGHPRDLEACAQDGDLISDDEALQIYRERMTYATYLTADGVRHTDGFTQANPEASDLPVNVPDEAPAILLSFFPDLSKDERAAILAATAIEGGWAFDRTKDDRPSWQRLDFAAAMTADVTRNEEGDLLVNGINASQADVTGININGQPLDGFDSGTSNYIVDLTATGGELPEIEATTAVPGVKVEVTLPDAVPGEAVIRVTSLDSSQTVEYRLALQVSDEVAKLSSLLVNGNAVANFDQDKTAYVVELPAGTTQVPVVSAQAVSNLATVDIVQPTSVTGTAQVTVTAPGGAVQRSYTIDFTVAPREDSGSNPQEPSPATVTAAITSTVTPSTFGKSAQVTVTVAAKGTVPQGRVAVTSQGASLGVAKLVQGRATLTLPADLSAGRHELTVTYIPQAGGSVVAPPQAGVVSLVVAKAKAKLGKVKVVKGKRNVKTIKRNARATVRVQVKKVAKVAPSGKITIVVGKKTVGSAKIKQVGKKYVALVKTKKVKAKGKVKVRYAGDATFVKSTYKTKLKAR